MMMEVQARKNLYIKFMDNMMTNLMLKMKRKWKKKLKLGLVKWERNIAVILIKDKAKIPNLADK
ncbi:hypothetical protein CBE01nite_09090 [Clostridium beijerinckii]|nr:hypothetical protein CBE01nite_09090 [Clostridium beijerinckii]